MSAIPHPTSGIPISDRILSPLREVSRRQWAVLAAQGVLQTLVVSLGALLVVALLLGYFQGLPAILRVPLALGVWAAIIWSGIHFLRPALRKWSLSRAALQVEHSLPHVQERISSAVELTEEPDDRFRGSPELVAHLVRQAEADASAIKPEEIIPTRRVVRWAMYLAPVLLAWLVLTVMKPQLVESGLFRALTPWKSQLPPMLSKVAVFPGDVTIAQGDDLQITAKISAEAAGADTKDIRATMLSKYPNGQSIPRDLDTIAPREFKTTLDSVQQGFKYMVSTDRGDSAWYTVTVHPRPAVASLDVRYDFPPYTGLETKTDIGTDGTIEALVGTRMTLIVHATGPLQDKGDKKNQVLIDENKDTLAAVKLAQVTGNDYQASFVVTHSALYRVQLSNEFGLTNKDDQPRNIIARFDQPPTIAIKSPAATISVRPDDVVPVQYLATDDFGVASIDALLQVDDKAPQTVKVKLTAKDREDFLGVYQLSVHEVVAASNLTDPRTITYQLKATDNRDPDPQSALSARQTLNIDKNTQSYETKLDQERASKLNQAIDKAIEKLNQAEPKIDPLRNADPNAQLQPQQKQDAKQAEQQIAQTSKDLNQAAKEEEHTPFAEVAKKVEQIADNPVQKAAEDTAKAELAPDQPQRAQDATKAHEDVEQAKQELTALKAEVQKAEQKAEAQQALEQAAREQAEVAKALAEHPEQRDQNQQKQREAIQKLQEAIQKDQALQNPQAQQVAQKLAELANKVQELQKQETAQQDQTARQEAAQQAQANDSKLAAAQKALNEEIQKFEQQDKNALQQAKADPPAQAQQNNIVDALNKNDLNNAAAQMKKQAAQLQQNAQALQQQAANQNPQQNAQQQAQAQKDQQAAQAAQQDQQQANQAAQALQQDAQQNQVPQKNDAAVQKAEQAAQQIEKQADALHPDNADAQKAADAAKQDAQQAAQDAAAAEKAPSAQQAQADLQKAAQELQQAGKELAQAAQQNQQADKAQADAQNKADAQQAAQQAQQLAQDQAALAQAAEKQQQADAAAQQGAQPPQQAAQQQQALAQQAQQDAQQAQALQQQAQQANNDNVAQRADQAQQALQQAAQEQQQAAQAEAQNHPAQAADHQAAAQQDLAKAEDALRGLQDAALAQADQGQHEQGQAEPGKPEQGQGDQGKPEQGQGQPEQGQGKPEQGQGQGHPEQGQGHPEQGQGQPQPGQPAQTPAQAAQEAAAAQQQALQPNPQAAQEAAQAVAQAAQANAQAQPGQPGQPESGPPEQGHEPGQEPGKESSPTPGEALVSGQGIQAQQAGGNNTRPESVKLLGISAHDWAKLPPLMRKELMNAAQQSGPAAYKEMIKNYYVRIARQQAETGTNVGRQQ